MASLEQRPKQEADPLKSRILIVNLLNGVRRANLRLDQASLEKSDDQIPRADLRSNDPVSGFHNTHECSAHYARALRVERQLLPSIH